MFRNSPTICSTNIGQVSCVPSECQVTTLFETPYYHQQPHCIQLKPDDVIKKGKLWLDVLHTLVTVGQLKPQALRLKPH